MLAQNQGFGSNFDYISGTSRRKRGRENGGEVGKGGRVVFACLERSRFPFTYPPTPQTHTTGANNQNTKIPMTAPVIFRRSAEDAGWLVSFYVPSKFPTMDEVPVPQNPDITITSLGAVTYAVKVFGTLCVPLLSPTHPPLPPHFNTPIYSLLSIHPPTHPPTYTKTDGFATIFDFESNEYQLKKALLADGVTPIEDKQNGVVWAGFDSPFVYVNRHNEVWVRVA